MFPILRFISSPGVIHIDMKLQMSSFIATEAFFNEHLFKYEAFCLERWILLSLRRDADWESKFTGRRKDDKMKKLNNESDVKIGF